MNNNKLKHYMISFSQADLISYLGEDLVDSLLEWHTGDRAILNKTNLASMILAIHGVNILKKAKWKKAIYYF